VASLGGNVSALVPPMIEERLRSRVAK